MEPSMHDLLVRQVSALVSTLLMQCAPRGKMFHPWRHRSTKFWLRIAPKSKGSQQHLQTARPPELKTA